MQQTGQISARLDLFEKIIGGVSYDPTSLNWAGTKACRTDVGCGKVGNPPVSSARVSIAFAEISPMASSNSDLAW